METSTNFPNISKEALNALRSEEAIVIYSELLSQGYGLMVDKKDYAKIVKSSTSSIDNYMSKGYGCPDYKKLGNAKNAKVLFSLIDIANYLASQTIRTA